MGFSYRGSTINPRSLSVPVLRKSYNIIKMLGFMITLLIAFSLSQHPTEAVGIIEFRAPVSVPHHPDATVEIFCHVEGNPAWQINGSLGFFDDLALNRGFTFQAVSLPIASSPPQYILNMTVEVAGNNNTDIRCAAISNSPGEPGVPSRTVTILVAGPPLPPSPMLKVVNATDLQLLWEEPFTSEGYGIKQYNISVEISNNTQTFVTTDSVFNWSREDIAQNCEELYFTVTATNDVGESETANISGEFPITPGPFVSPVEYDVTFFSDGRPRLEVYFSPPQICHSQSSSFIITIQKLDENGTVYTEGPVGYASGSGAERIMRDIRSGLERNQMYLITVLFSTVAGESYSSATVTTESPNPPTIIDLPIDPSPASGTDSPNDLPVDPTSGSSMVVAGKLLTDRKINDWFLVYSYILLYAIAV